MSKKQKRPQRSKRERDYIQHVQDLRRGSTTSRHASEADYRRKPKHGEWGDEDE